MDKTMGNEQKNIVLIGYMGAGKSAVGQALADLCGYDLLDTDQYIVEKEGMSINDIFSKKGEAYFRQLETDVVKELKNKLKNTVISTGGGLPMKEENRTLLKELGRVFYLKATADTTYKRVSSTHDRPLLENCDMYEKICAMLLERTPKYEAASDVIIDTDELSVEDICSVIMKNVTE